MMESEKENVECESGSCSMALLKSGCPTCALVGLVIGPFELLVRLGRKLFPRGAS